jgi:hypothetical protein
MQTRPEEQKIPVGCRRRRHTGNPRKTCSFQIRRRPSRGGIESTLILRRRRQQSRVVGRLETYTTETKVYCYTWSARVAPATPPPPTAKGRQGREGTGDQRRKSWSPSWSPYPQGEKERQTKDPSGG